MKRPEIKDHFPSDTTLSDLHKIICDNPELYRYICALDLYIDHLEEDKLNSTAKDLQKEFENTGKNSWIDSDLYPNGRIYTQEYTEWLEKKVLSLRKFSQLSN